MVYTIFLSTASSSTGGISVQISGVTLSASSGLTMNVKNSGSNAITDNSTITITGSLEGSCGVSESSTDACGGVTGTFSTIAPGGTQTVVIPSGADISGDFGVTITPGTTYTITLVAADTAGSTASFTYSVTATS